MAKQSSCDGLEKKDSIGEEETSAIPPSSSDQKKINNNSPSPDVRENPPSIQCPSNKPSSGLLVVIPVEATINGLKVRHLNN